MRAKALLLLLICVPLLLPVAPVAAQSGDNACVVLVLDDSGSMAENDPSFLRNTGAKLFITLLDDGDRVGIVRFSTGAARVTPEMVMLATPEDKRALLALIQDRPPDGYTDIQAALREALALLRDADCDSPTIVLLSDGYPQLPDGLPADYEQQTVTLIRELGAPLFGIALTIEGESGLMYQLAGATEPRGLVISARTADDLLDAYLDVLAHLKDRTVIGSGDTIAPDSATLPLQPGLAQFVSRVTYIVSKPIDVSAALLTPAGQDVVAAGADIIFSYEADPRFAVFTVDNPAPGDWGFSLDGTGSVQARAILRSRLRIAPEQPYPFHPQHEPMPLAAALVEETLSSGAPATLIGEATFSAEIVRPDGSLDIVDQLYDDGTHGDMRAGDGVFSHDYVKTDLPGEYLVAFTGYKGVIPATRAVRVQVTSFPQPIIVSPASNSFEFRGSPLALELRLEGGEPARLDTGSFNVVVSEPGGGNRTVELTGSGDRFHGQFTPDRDGLHGLRFEPVAATYKGVQYLLPAERNVEMTIIPTIRPVQPLLEAGLVEVANLATGVSLQVALISSSPRTEPITLSPAGVPGLRVTGLVPEEVPPGEATIFVTIAGDLAPGAYGASLLLGARDGVDLPVREIPVSFTVYQPTVTVAPEIVEMGEIRVDWIAEGALLTLALESTSLRDEEVQLSWLGTPGVTLQTEAATIAGGESDETTAVLAMSEAQPGVVSGQIMFSGRDGLQIEPAVVPVMFSVVPVPWCARWCPPLALGAVVALVAGGAALAYLQRRPRPWGMLRPVKGPAGQPLPPVMPIAAGALGVIAIIGTSSRANMRLSGGRVKSKHAAFKVTTQITHKRIGRPPRLVEVVEPVNVVRNVSGGVVKVNGSPVEQGRDSAVLTKGTRIAIGDYEFVYEGG